MPRIFSLILFVVVSIVPSFGQRNVTPVETDDKKPEQPTLHYYDKHGKALDEPVLFLATLDTVSSQKVSPKPIYPKFFEANGGVNFFDAFLAMGGSHYGGADVWANISLWNWIFPTVELGLGGASKTPDGLNYTYKGYPGFYAKLGADYNFLYKSNPRYQLLAGLRLGVSAFRYALKNVTVSNDYWQETAKIDLPSAGSAAVFGEVLFGLKVNVWENISMGWTARYHFLFSNKANHTKPSEGAPFGADIKPWYIPGFGTRGSHFGFTFSVIYTLPLAPEHYLLPQPEED